MKYKVDLHTHSIISHDGGLSEKDYKKLLDEQRLDYIAVTDHNETRFARILQEKLGERIIVGEEIKTQDGEMIGLFLKETVRPGLTAHETAEVIHAQDALVCIPHPFETFRSGIKHSVLKEIVKEIDIIEVFNARGRWRGFSNEAQAFALAHTLSETASSDAHCPIGIGGTYSIVDGEPKRNTLKKLLSKPVLQKKYAPLLALLCPTVNKIRNKLILTSTP